MTFFADDICVVGAGAVLPGAPDCDAFLADLLEGRCLIQDVSRLEGDPRFELMREFVDPDRDAPDRTYSGYAAFVAPGDIARLAQSLDLPLDRHTHLEVMATEAVRQALHGLQTDLRGRKAQIAFGYMNPPGVGHYLADRLKARTLRDVRDGAGEDDADSRALGALLDRAAPVPGDFVPALSYTLGTTMIAGLKKRFSIQGPGILVDAACASSLSALDAVIRRLRNREADWGLAGGLEGNLSSASFVTFAKMGALSGPDSPGLPFDRRSTGISQGEGAVAFVLERLEDALRFGHRIQGVIRSCGGSSDGRSSSIFQPTAAGQALAYQRAYAGIADKRVDYVEAHGTGTPVGDVTEIESLTRFFPDLSIPMGSVKSNLGHTKGAAGAASLLKCLLAIRERVVPPSPYFTGFPKGVKSDFFVNTRPISLRKHKHPLRMGVSSFGFGGANYHLVVEEYRDNTPVVPAPARTAATVVVCGSSRVSLDEWDDCLARTSFKIPPASLPHMDRLQVLSIFAVERALWGSRVNMDLVPGEEVSVISASTVGLDALHLDCGERLGAVELGMRLRRAGGDPRLADRLCAALRTRIDSHPAITEDTAAGILNNVIAGRVCNVFDFRGRNYNVDCDQLSFAAAVDQARLDLQTDPGLVIVLGVSERIDEAEGRVVRDGIDCLLLTTLDYALERELPVRQVLDTVRYQK